MKVELSIYCKDLKNVAGAFKGTSDPFAVVTKLASTVGAAPEVLGKTEVIKNNLSPDWAKVFVLDYELGSDCKVAVSVFDEVRKGDNKSMGVAIFDIGELLGARGNTKAKRAKKGGMIYAHVRKSVGTGVLRLVVQGEKLKNTEGFLRKSDPFFELHRKVDAAGAATWDTVVRSNVVQDNLSPQWKELAIELSILCGGNKDLPLRLNVYDYESKGDHVLMGSLETSVNGLVQAASSKTTLTIAKKGKETGTLIVTKADVSGEEADIEQRMAATSISKSTPKNASFLDFVSGNCEFNVVVAIDFTGSNGDPRKPGTLHYFGGGKNDYEKAMTSIVGILSKFDSDQQFPVLGFGAKYDGVVRHAFQVGPTEEVHGVKGVVDAYHQVFRSGFIMSGPTDFTEVMQTAAARAQSSLDAALSQGKQTYTVLVILTDGAVSDVEATKECLKAIQDSPLSIVIVGVGDADFSSMEFLDNLPGQRDIAQFVPFSKYASSPADLSAATLHEIPHQLEAYFAQKGIAPSKAIDEAEIVIEDQEEEIDLSLDIGEEEIVISGGGRAVSSW